MTSATTVTSRSVCPYCGVGCGVLIESEGQRITGVRGDPAHPANFGRLCSKGAALHLTTAHSGRLAHPELRRHRADLRQSTDWETTLDYLCARFSQVIDADGPDAVGFYLSGQLLTEDYYVFNKLAKGLIGTNNIDSNSRLCMSSAVAGYKATLGADAPPGCYEDIDHADLVVIAGANPAYAHPVLYRRLEAARAQRPLLKTIVIDPRRTPTAEDADLHLALLPGTDVALFNGLLHLLLWEGKLDQAYIAAHTSGFSELKAILHEYTPAIVSKICGIREDDLRLAATLWADSRATLSLYCQGLNQSANGTANNAALINLHLATGQLGRPGAGPFSLTGQPNAMGGREVGGMANLLSAHRDLANPAHRAEVAALWGVPSVPALPGKTALEMFEAVAAGEIKILWIAGTNPAQSLPNQAVVRAALQKAELVILQEAFAHTETAAFADVVLPAASWGEKDGTMTNSERRIARVRAAVAAPGEARADWQIAVDFARRLERTMRPGLTSLFPYRSPGEVFAEHGATTQGRDVDITGLSYATLEAQGPQQWPYPAGATGGMARLYADGRFPTDSGRARFYPAQFVPVAEPPDARYPLTLNTGRLRDQWHGMTRSGRVTQLFSHVAQPMLEMNADDMQRRKLPAGALVRVRSRRGEVILPVTASAAQRVGQVFIPMHWGSAWWRGPGINGLTTDARDPTSMQPELKACAVAVDSANLPWELVAMTILEVTDKALADQRLAGFQAQLERFEYASCGRFGSVREGVIFRAAGACAPSTETLHAIEQLLGFSDPAQRMSYEDPSRGVRRVLQVEAGKLVGLMLAGNVAGQDWLQHWLDAGESVTGLGPQLLAPNATPPTGATPLSRMICSCEQVSERALELALDSLDAIDDGAYAWLQIRLKCGIQCGSCGPEIRHLIASRRAAA